MTQPERPFERGASAPAFDEAWQAQAFVLVCHLHEKGCFTWSEWAAVLSEVIKAADAKDPEDTGAAYYEHWLSALERIIAAKGIVSSADVDRLEWAWRDAYATTPHGEQVQL